MVIPDTHQNLYDKLAIVFLPLRDRESCNGSEPESHWGFKLLRGLCVVAGVVAANGHSKTREARLSPDQSERIDGISLCKLIALRGKHLHNDALDK